MLAGYGTVTPNRRTAILRAALASFEEHGFEAATIEDVRRRSGASIGSIYHHFSGKEQLAGALYVDVLAGYQDGLLAALDRHPGARAGVRAVVEHHVAWVVAHPAEARFLLGGRPAAAESGLRAANRAFFARVTGWLDGHVAAGAVAAAPFDVFHALWLGPAQEWSRHWLSDRAPTPPDQATPLLADAAWAALSKEIP